MCAYANIVKHAKFKQWYLCEMGLWVGFAFFFIFAWFSTLNVYYFCNWKLLFEKHTNL